MKRFAALALMTVATGAAVAMAASPASAGDKGYDGYDGYHDLNRTVVEQGHYDGYGYPSKLVVDADDNEWNRGHSGYGYWPEKDDKGKDKHWGKDKGYGYY